MPFADIAFPIATYLIVINGIAFVVFAWDKHCARNGAWRVPERNLLWLAAAGASPGVIVGQRILRHKTRKEPFRTYLLLIVVAQVVGLVALCFPQVRNSLWN